jgi:hypothetical protein
MIRAPQFYRGQAFFAAGGDLRPGFFNALYLLNREVWLSRHPALRFTVPARP